MTVEVEPRPPALPQHAALAVFHDHGGGWLRPFLRPGFRHCFAAVAAGGYWIAVDGRRGLPAMTVVAAADYDLAAFYRGLGYTVAAMTRASVAARTPFALATCVGVAKRVLGVRAPLALTPYWLWKRLERSKARLPLDTPPTLRVGGYSGPTQLSVRPE